MVYGLWFMEEVPGGHYSLVEAVRTPLAPESLSRRTGCIDEGDAAGVQRHTTHLSGGQYLVCSQGSVLQTPFTLICLNPSTPPTSVYPVTIATLSSALQAHNYNKAFTKIHGSFAAIYVQENKLC